MGFVCGFWFKPRNKRPEPLTASSFWFGLGLLHIFTAAALASARIAPEWMWMYFYDGPVLEPMALLYIYAFLYLTPFGAGYGLGFALPDHRRKLAWLVVLTLLSSEGWIVHHLFDRYAMVGTTPQYIAGTGKSLFDPNNPVGPIMNGAGVLMVLWIFGGLFFWRRARTKP